jgi:hypothetical protein
MRLDKETRRRLKEVKRALGERGACRLLDANRTTLRRALDGKKPITRGTVAHLRLALAAVERDVEAFRVQP